jgi:hypothetical protein
VLHSYIIAHNIYTFAPVYNGEEKKNDMELCGAACASFCDKIVLSASVAA